MTEEEEDGEGPMTLKGRPHSSEVEIVNAIETANGTRAAEEADRLQPLRMVMTGTNEVSNGCLL